MSALRMLGLGLTGLPYGTYASGFAVLLWGAGAQLLTGCGGARPTTTANPGSAGGLGLQQSFQADVVPVRALAASDSFLWIGSDRGLRRAPLPVGAAEWMVPVEGLPQAGVSALATDRLGRLLVATGAVIGRLTDPDSRPQYQQLAALPGVTRLVPVMAEGAGDGIWVGTARGLFFLEGTGAVAIDGAGGAEITSLDLDGDGKSIWAGLRGKGLVHVAAKQVIAAHGPDAADHLDLAEVLGTAVLSNGTRIAVGRGAKGETRLALLRMEGAQLLAAQPADIPVVAVIPQPRHPLLIAGPTTAPRLFTLTLSERGEIVEGGLRFSPVRKSLEGMRVVARPDSRPVPPETTAVLGPGAGRGNGDSPGDVFLGTRAAGVARLSTSMRGSRDVPDVGGSPAAVTVPDYLPVGELAMGARGLSVACLEPERCVFSTGAGPGWIWDGRDRSIKPIPEGAIGGSLMALAGEGAGTVYFVSGDGGKVLSIARLSADGARWEPLLKLPVLVEGSALVTFATLSPQGNLWLALRDRSSSGQEFGRGVIEVQLPSGRAIHHRPYRNNEERPPDAIPIVGDVAAVRFVKGSAAGADAMWFCTSVGVMRFVAGDLSRWGENEGLDSERCHDLAIASDGTVWVATEEGPARFDGKGWMRLPGTGAAKTGGQGAGRTSATAPRWPVDREDENLAARALVGIGQGLWAGTPRGVWPVNSVGNVIDRASGLIDDDIVDLERDRFGRLWVLGHIGLTVREAQR